MKTKKSDVVGQVLNKLWKVRQKIGYQASKCDAGVGYKITWQVYHPVDETFRVIDHLILLQLEWHYDKYTKF